MVKGEDYCKSCAFKYVGMSQPEFGTGVEDFRNDPLLDKYEVRSEGLIVPQKRRL